MDDARTADVFRAIARYFEAERMTYRQTVLVVSLKVFAREVEKDGFAAAQRRLPAVVATAKEVSAPYFQ